MSVGAAILGCGIAVPDRVVTNADLERSLETTDEWIRRRTGISSRRIAAPGEATSTFAAAAAAEALKAADLVADDLDLVCVATCTPDFPVPGASPLVQATLGAGGAGCVDLNAGCCGFVHGLAVAASAVETGRGRHVLVCGADTLSRVTDPTDRRTAVLFGDGAGAVVVGPADGDTRFGRFTFGTDGTKASWLIVPAGGSARPADAGSVADGGHAIRMHGQDVYKHATERMTEVVRELLGPAGPGAVDIVVAHQANARITETVAERVGLRSEQVVSNIDRYGNTSAASIPVALAEAEEDGRLLPGMRVLLVAFGAGFSWAGGLVEWGRP